MQEVFILITREFLSCHKTETTPQFQKELLQLIYESLLQIRFPQSRIILKIQEPQNIGILYEFLCSNSCQQVFGLCLHRSLVTACKESLVVHGGDLSLKLTA